MAVKIETMAIRIINGGIEQGLLEAANEDGLLSDLDKKRLKHLQSLPPDRMESDGKIYEVPEHYYSDKKEILNG